MKAKRRKYTVPMVSRDYLLANGTCLWRLPIKVVSEANQAEHWRKRAKRKKAQKEAMHAFMAGLSSVAPPFPVIVKFTKLNWGKKALDTDNLAGAFKHVQDAMAEILGCDDGERDKVTWEYDQMPYHAVGIYVELRRKDGA